MSRNARIDFLGDDSLKNLDKAIEVLSKLTPNVDIRFSYDMDVALLLQELFDLATALDMQDALSEVNKMIAHNKLKTFEHVRKTILNDSDSEIAIMTGDMTEKLRFKDLLKEWFGILPID